MIFGLEQWLDSDAPALIDDEGERWLSYGALIEAVTAGADAIRQLGRPTVFLFGRNDIPSAVTYLACLEAGAPVASLRADLKPDRIAALIELYRPGLVCGVAPGAEYRLFTSLELPAWRRSGGATEAHPLLAQLLSTSGSTGSPRMVRLSRSAVEANARSIREALAIGPTERSLLSLPLSYSYGLSVLNSHLAAGASVLLTERGLTDRLYWARAAEHRVTSMPGVPYVYQTLKRLGFEALAPASLNTLTQAGGKLADALVEHFHRLMAARGGRFFVMYGQTEASARMTILDSAALPAQLGSVGRAIPEGTLAIDPETGEILYRGPNVMLGYAENDADLLKGDVLGGLLATGDLGTLDDGGFLRITGRMKRIAKINGSRINLDEVEALAARYAPAAALEGDNQLIIVLEAVLDEAERQAIRRTLSESLAVPPASLRLRCIAKLPVGINGKLDRDALRQVA